MRERFYNRIYSYNICYKAAEKKEKGNAQSQRTPIKQKDLVPDKVSRRKNARPKDADEIGQ